MRYVLPIVFCIPMALSWILILFAQLAPVNGSDEVVSAENESLKTIGMTLIGLSLLACAASIAMLFIRPGTREWRFAAIFNGVSWSLVLLFVLLLQYAHG